MTTRAKHGRLTEEQKRSVPCPLCFAGAGKPCKATTSSPKQYGLPLTRSHDARKARAAYKISLEKIRASVR